MQFKIKLLNNGYLVQFADTEVLIDPASDETRLAHADLILLTHLGLQQGLSDHMRKLCLAAPGAKLLVPESVYKSLEVGGLDLTRTQSMTHGWFDCGSGLSVRALGDAMPVAGNNRLAEQTADGYAAPNQSGKQHLGATAFLICFDHKSPQKKELIPAGDLTRSTAESTQSIQSTTSQVSTQLLVLGNHASLDPLLLKELETVGEIHTVVLAVGSQNRFQQQGRQTNGYFSVHEAFDLAELLRVAQIVVRPHELVTASEVRAVFEARSKSQARIQRPNLLIEPDYFFVGCPQASVIIRTLNEARYLDELLGGIRQQQTDNLDTEVVLVDSGSTDGTLAIAEKHGCKIVHIKREEFSFGRSLNRGCEVAQGDVLVITSGHCVPANDSWLQNLCRPLIDGIAQYSYGKQLGGPNSYFSECRVFDKYFPDTSKLPQDGFYCNNANSALLKTTWQRYRFDEELTGLEDMALAQRMVRDGGRVAYVADAPVYHYHSETWSQVRRRFEREAIALQQIMPNVHVGWFDTLRYTMSSIWGDLKKAAESKQLTSNFTSIIRYRYYQYTGSYRGNQQHRKLSQTEKDQYFYPH